MGMTFSHLLSGFAGFAATFVAPPYSADSGVIRNAIVLLLSFALLGVAVALIAHRVDPRVYVASDVEHILGFAPMAQLPDFSEVPNEVTEEHLLRLASAIDRAFKDRDLSHCVFTGTGPGAGVTTVGAGVKKMLATMGQAEGKPRETVLVDAAPLAGSEETAQLVRSADCTIVVIESGVTTRAQLRIVANILQRIKAPAVGFVLNRVRLAKADPAFRRSVREMERQLRKRGQATDWHMLRTLESAIEKGRSSLDLDHDLNGAGTPDNPPANARAETNPQDQVNTREMSAAMSATDAAPFKEAAPADAPGSINEIVPAALQSAPEPQSSLFSESAKQVQEQIPSQLAQFASLFKTEFPEPKAEHGQIPQMAPNGANGNGSRQVPAIPAPEDTARISLPRLSELRGMSFSQALRGLDQAKRSAPSSAGPVSLNSSINDTLADKHNETLSSALNDPFNDPISETLMRAIAPFELMFNPMESAHAQNGGSPEDARNGLHAPSETRAFIPIPEAEVFPAAENGAAAMHGNDAAATKDNGAQRRPSQPKSFPQKPALPARSKALRGEDGERSPREPKGPGQETGGFLDQLHILPSRRGQYKKKS
jgi:hypothetical protein